jgi:TonB family protein
MGSTNDTGLPGAAKPATVTDRRNVGWNRAVLGSMVLAAAVHALLFLLWPAWQLVYSSSEPRTELIQIQPISSYGAFFDEGDSRLASTPSVEPQERALDQGDDAGETEGNEEWADVFNFPAPPPTMAESIIPRATERIRETSMPALILEHMASARAEVVLSASVTWPVIRNPNVLTRYLRSRYNTLYRTGSEGYVSVMMYIDERGSVGYAEVRESSGFEALDAIALDAFNQIVAFAPARDRGTPVPIAVTISVPFNSPW